MRFCFLGNLNHSINHLTDLRHQVAVWRYEPSLDVQRTVPRHKEASWPGNSRLKCPAFGQYGEEFVSIFEVKNCSEDWIQLIISWKSWNVSFICRFLICRQTSDCWNTCHSIQSSTLQFVEQALSSDRFSAIFFFRFLNPGKCNKTRVHAENLSNSSNKKTRNDQKYNKYAVSAGGQNNRYLREFDLTREEECNLNNAFFFAAESVILR